MGGFYKLLPQTVKVLKLDPISASDTVVFLRSLTASVAPIPFGKILTHISLVVDNITNTLLFSISNTLPLLAKLDLEDHLRSEPLATNDFTDLGIQTLTDCKHLTSLYFERSQKYIHTSFKFVTDKGMFYLAEGCKQLENYQLVGFSNIFSFGFRKFLTSCLNLKKFEIEDAAYLEFKALSKVRKTVVEVKLVSCYLIDSETVHQRTTFLICMSALM